MDAWAQNSADKAVRLRTLLESEGAMQASRADVDAFCADLVSKAESWYLNDARVPTWQPAPAPAPTHVAAPCVQAPHAQAQPPPRASKRRAAAPGNLYKTVTKLARTLPGGGGGGDGGGGGGGGDSRRTAACWRCATLGRADECRPGPGGVCTICRSHGVSAHECGRAPERATAAGTAPAPAPEPAPARTLLTTKCQRCRKNGSTAVCDLQFPCSCCRAAKCACVPGVQDRGSAPAFGIAVDV